MNYFRLDNKATGGAPIIVATGTDTDIGMNFATKGTGAFSFFDDSYTAPLVQINSGTPGSNVNYLILKPATTGNWTEIGAWGSDTNIGLNLSTKGTGVVTVNGSAVATTSSLSTKADVLAIASGKLLTVSNSSGAAINTHPESSGFVNLPHIVNDIAYNDRRGGSVVWKKNGSVVTPTNPNNPFKPDSTFTNGFSIATPATDTITAEVTLHKAFNWSAKWGIVMTEWCTAKDVQIEVWDNIASSWATAYTTTNDTSGFHWISYAAGSGNDMTKVRYTLSNFVTTDVRITQLWVAEFNSPLLSGPFLPRGGGALYGTNAAPPALDATGSDADIGLTLHPKGAAAVSIYTDSGVSAGLYAGGVDTNVDLNLYGKGTGVVKAGGNPVLTSVTAVSAVTGTPNSTTYLRGDGTWASPSAGSSGMLLPAQHHTDGSETYTITSGSITQINGTTIQGQAVSVGDRIVVATAPASSGAGAQYNFTTQPANGVYVVSGNTTNLTVARASDMSGSVNPAGLSIFSENASAGWLAQAIFTVTTPSSASAFTYGSGNIRLRTTGGASLLPNSVYIGNTTNSLGWWNGAYSTYLNPQATAANQTLTLPATTSDTLIGATNLPAVNGNSAAQSQLVVSGTNYYITGSNLTAVPSPAITGMVVGTRFVWRVAMTKDANGTGTFQITIYRGTNGSTSDTQDVLQTIGTQTAAVDNMTVDVEVVVTATGATGSYYWSIIPNNNAASATGFGVTTGTGAYFSGSVSSVAMNTASLKFGLGFKSTTGTPTITIPFVQANAYKLV